MGALAAVSSDDRGSGAFAGTSLLVVAAVVRETIAGVARVESVVSRGAETAAAVDVVVGARARKTSPPVVSSSPSSSLLLLLLPLLLLLLIK
jgi:hypothetical protein